VKVLREIERENVSSISIRNDPKAVVESVSHPSRGRPNQPMVGGPLPPTLYREGWGPRVRITRFDGAAATHPENPTRLERERCAGGTAHRLLPLL
jgi:hypothetical protein